MLKKILSLAITLALCLAIAPLTALAAVTLSLERDIYGPWKLWSLGKRNEQTASDSLSGEIALADALGLIPDCLNGKDLTKSITRAEFAAVSVKLYEVLSGTEALPVSINPFTDTDDIEVMKAYNVGITDGTAPGKFSPDMRISREQVAVMLTRVYKRVTMEGWTLANDRNFTLQYVKPGRFGDDGEISEWAKDSVYFMATNSIILGTGNNMFTPRAATTAENAVGYAKREQALAIAVRVVKKFGD